MKTFKTNYKTSKTTGTLVVTKENNKYFGSFDGLEKVEIMFGCKQGLNGCSVNLKSLSSVGFNCPNTDVNAFIVLPHIVDLKVIFATLQAKTESGKWCEDGMWRTHKELRNMSYSEKVLTGEYSE